MTNEKKGFKKTTTLFNNISKNLVAENKKLIWIVEQNWKQIYSLKDWLNLDIMIFEKFINEKKLMGEEVNNQLLKLKDLFKQLKNLVQLNDLEKRLDWYKRKI